MLCEKCGKRTATVFYTDIEEGKVTQLHLCKECAEAIGVTHSSSSGANLAVSNLLAGMLDGGASLDDAESDSTCSICGLAYADFKAGGRLGCPNCYDCFSAGLRHLLRRIHGSNLHEGKAPVSHKEMVDEKREVRRLKDLLQRAIDAEEFERAAEIRDQLRELEVGPVENGG
ncbi:MAG: UvrB/UvrC motif-containing protein [Candidatus Eisenbacteria sp.]|nr:UvrB/UvrC motif-containing protein [Candidatus Eisenbacteria bacterium]